MIRFVPMCGIAGIYRAGEGEDLSPTVRAMLSRLARRGPDSEGVIEAGPVVLGHRRLAILDLSDAGRQPMASVDGRWIISFNGEIYNYRDLQQELGLADGDLRTRTDTEVLLAAWARWGTQTPEHLVGQWAFAVYDRRDRRLWLCRDRFGEKPLYYHHDPATHRLTFASTIPALLAARWVPRTIDPSALVEYTTLRYVIAPRTILRDIRKLPGGHLLAAKPDGVSITTWYRPRFRPDIGNRKRRRDDLCNEFTFLLSQAARRCLVSDVPVALLLSDGLDSHSILAAVKRQGGDLSAFHYRTAGMSSPQDHSSGRQDSSGVSVRDLVVTPGERLEQMSAAYGSFTEPVGDGASLATWFLIRNARQHATVFLCGHGADEVLGGYRLSQDRFRLALLRRFAWLPLRAMDDAIRIYCHGGESIAERRRRIGSATPAQTPERARFLIHRPLPSTDVAALFAPRAAQEPYLQGIDQLYAGCDAESTDLDRIQEVLVQTFLAANILSFADSVAMDSSAELRMPYLDRDLVDFVCSLLPRWRVSRWPGVANTKCILREAGRNILPESILRAGKRTFAYGSVRTLLRDHRGAIEDMILGSEAVRRELPGLAKWLSHPPEYFHSTWEGTLWALLTLSIWCESAGIR
ncbi:MAG: asparagine synthase (glutamine-hydrolyzing) [Acidobacteriota bacterium]